MKSALLSFVILWLTIFSAAAKSESNASGARPGITEQPIGRNVSEGGFYAASITATGSVPLAVQWWRGTNALTNDVRISGTTNFVLNIDPVQTNDAGSYFAIVSNSSGMATSAPVSLVVSQILLQLTPVGSTGALLTVFGQIGDVYRIEVSLNFAAYTTNGYATNLNGITSYFYNGSRGGGFIRLRAPLDRMLPVLYSGTPGLARAYGKLNQAWRFEASQDLQTWTPLYIVTNLTGWVTFGDPRDFLPQKGFYRIAPP